MIKFDITEHDNGKNKIQNFYVIYGREKDTSKRKLLIIGDCAGDTIPVIDLTTPLQESGFYSPNDNIEDVCKDFHIDLDTVHCLDDSASFTLIFQHDEGDD